MVQTYGINEQMFKKKTTIFSAHYFSASNYYNNVILVIKFTNFYSIVHPI